MTGRDGSHPDAVRLTAACRAATTPEEPEDAGLKAGKEDFNQMTQNDLDDIISRLRDSIQTGGTPVPPGYDFETALKAVRRQLSEDKGDGPDWQSGSATSLANALYDMVTLGLSLEDKSCYLFRKSRTSPQYVLRRSYYGTQKVVRELYPDCRIFAAAVYDGEQFSLGKFVNGRPEAIIHFPDLACINNGRIVASYAVITDRDDKVIGYEKEKESLYQLCDMAKNPEKYAALGVKLPHGVLLHGVYCKSSPYNTVQDYGIDEANLWGDYFYMEALTRRTRRWQPYWA